MDRIEMSSQLMGTEQSKFPRYECGSLILYVEVATGSHEVERSTLAEMPSPASNFLSLAKATKCRGLRSVRFS